jgi:hypothetical protein
LATLCEDLSVAHRRLAEDGLEGGTARALRRLEGRPATQAGAEACGGILLQPLQPLRAIVLEGTGQAVGAPDCVAAHAAPVCDELGEGAHGGALGLERRQLVAMGQQQCEWEFGLRRVVFGPAGRQGCAIPRQRQRIDRKEDEKVLLGQGRDHGPWGKVEADGHGWAVEPRTPRGAPRINGLRGVSELQALTVCGARSLETHIMVGICPVDPTTGSKGVV